MLGYGGMVTNVDWVSFVGGGIIGSALTAAYFLGHLMKGGGVGNVWGKAPRSAEDQGSMTAETQGASTMHRRSFFAVLGLAPLIGALSARTASVHASRIDAISGEVMLLRPMVSLPLLGNVATDVLLGELADRNVHPDWHEVEVVHDVGWPALNWPAHLGMITTDEIVGELNWRGVIID